MKNIISKIKEAVKWPNWYWMLILIELFAVSTELVPRWTAWAIIMLGFIVWAFKNVTAE
jgi:hypothetical protein